MPFRQEPSLSSRKEKVLASRRVRTQPCRKRASFGAAALSASLMRVRDMEVCLPGNEAVPAARRKPGNASQPAGHGDNRTTVSRRAAEEWAARFALECERLSRA